MNTNDKNTKVEMNAAEMKAVSGGTQLGPIVAIPTNMLPVFQVLPGGFRHW